MTNRWSRLLAVALTCAVTTTLAACNGVDATPDAADQPGASGAASPGAEESTAPEVPPVKVMANVELRRPRRARRHPADPGGRRRHPAQGHGQLGRRRGARQDVGRQRHVGGRLVARARHRLRRDDRGPALRRRRRRHAAYELPHRRPDPGPADLPVGGAAGRRDRGRGHAGDRHVRRRGDRQGHHREAPERHLDAQAARCLALDLRPRGALEAQVLLARRHRRGRRRRHQQRAGRRRDLRPGGPSRRVPRRLGQHLQGQRPDPPDAGVQRRASCSGPSRSPRASPASPRARG